MHGAPQRALMMDTLRSSIEPDDSDDSDDEASSVATPVRDAAAHHPELTLQPMESPSFPWSMDSPSQPQRCVPSAG
jgi:hypothetical protein